MTVETSNMSRMMFKNPVTEKEEHISLVLLELSKQLSLKEGEEGKKEIEPGQYVVMMENAARYIGHLEKSIENIVTVHDQRLDWIRDVLRERKTVALVKKVKAKCIQWRIIPLGMESQLGVKKNASHH